MIIETMVETPIRRKYMNGIGWPPRAGQAGGGNEGRVASKEAPSYSAHPA